MTPHIEARGVTKRFGGTVALDSVDVGVERGTVHALVGENGAGKSTLGKIIAGVHVPDEGSLFLDGEEVQLRSPSQALDAGITLVAQELSLVDTLTVVENVMLGMEASHGPVLSPRDDRKAFDALVDRHGIAAPPEALVGTLSTAAQQKVEILRALARSSELIVMDEPTARLTSTEAGALRDTVRSLAENGVTIVFVSHFLEEVLAIADRITIMRDGRVIRTSDHGAETHDTLIEGIVGRSLEATFPDRVVPDSDAPVVLDVQGIARVPAFDDVSFQVRSGEIVGLAGIVGSGRTEVVRSVFGAASITGGTMKLNGEPYHPSRPSDAIEAQVAMVPESRKTEGLFPAMDVKANMTMAALSDWDRFGIIDSREEREAAQHLTDEVGLTGATVKSKMLELSGGNQQKALFGRWLARTPTLFIADEPTRGVDVGAKRGIYQLLAGLAAQGIGVLIVSSELEEVLGLSHRILVMRGGRIVAELDGSGATEEEVMFHAIGGSG